MLREAGYRQRAEQRELVLHDPENQTEFFYLRPRDIAVYVGSGVSTWASPAVTCCSTAVRRLRRSSRSASPDPRSGSRPDQAPRRRCVISTGCVSPSYPGLVAKHLADQGVDADVTRLDGAVETAVQLGVADVVADVVETGATLRHAGLEIVGEPILESEAVLIRHAGDPSTRDVDQLVRRLQGVLVARRYVMMDYDIRAEAAEAGCRITPGIESPTVSPCRLEGWVAVRAMVPRTDTHRVMDELWDIGARGIIVTDIHACRL